MVGSALCQLQGAAGGGGRSFWCMAWIVPQLPSPDMHVCPRVLQTFPYVQGGPQLRLASSCIKIHIRIGDPPPNVGRPVNLPLTFVALGSEVLRVCDLFCGPGGISEGLRQAGFKTVYALDKDAAAVDTFRRNHPEALVEHRDVTDIESEKLPEFDILVGGPPCVEFSSSKGNRGNILEGLRLVQAFLRVVYERKPRYWIMENVPRIVLHLPEEIPLTWIGVKKEGTLHVPIRAEFNCADFGVPQTRKRFLLGNYPRPRETHSESTRGTGDLFGEVNELPPWRTLGEVLRALPSPLGGRRGTPVRDPNYGFTIPEDQLTDQFQDVILGEREARQIMKAKTAHPYMGAMAFPDDSNRPARTVVATQLGRETLIIADSSAGRIVYRRATARECATLQGFPITYQFWASGINAKYRLAGDAVPPPLTYLIGCGIRQLEGLPALVDGPDVRREPLTIAPMAAAKPTTRKPTAFQESRKFAELVPGKEVRGCRVELVNQGSSPGYIPCVIGKHLHSVQWCARLYVGEGRQMASIQVGMNAALKEFAAFFLASPENYERTLQFLRDAEQSLPTRLPDASTLQAVWTNRHTLTSGPEEVIDLLASFVEEHFPKDAFQNSHIPRSGELEIVPLRGLRVRLGAALVLTAYASELINYESAWLAANPHSRYLPQGVAAKDGEGGSPRSIRPPSEVVANAAGSRRKRPSALAA